MYIALCVHQLKLNFYNKHLIDKKTNSGLEKENDLSSQPSGE